MSCPSWTTSPSWRSPAPTGSWTSVLSHVRLRWCWQLTLCWWFFLSRDNSCLCFYLSRDNSCWCLRTHVNNNFQTKSNKQNLQIIQQQNVNNIHQQRLKMWRFHLGTIPLSVLQWHYTYLNICLFELLCCDWPYLEDCRHDNGEFLRKGNGKDSFLLRLTIEKRPSEVFLENKF